MPFTRCYSKTFPLIRLGSYYLIMFIYFWSSNFAGNVVLEREHGRQDAISCLLPCVLYCMEGEFEQIMTKIRWGIKENKNYITAE